MLQKTVSCQGQSGSRRCWQVLWSVVALGVLAACSGGVDDQVSGSAVNADAAAPGGALVLSLDGAEAGVSHDVLQVDGSAQLAGTLDLVFSANYTPAAGQKFTLIHADGGVRGDFLSVTNNKGLTLKTSRDANNFYVTVNP